TSWAPASVRPRAGAECTARWWRHAGRRRSRAGRRHSPFRRERCRVRCSRSSGSSPSPRSTPSATASNPSGKAVDGLAQSEQRVLELDLALERSRCQLPPQLALAQAEQELGAGVLADALGVRARIELGEEADRLLVESRAVDEMREDPAARRVLEV